MVGWLRARYCAVLKICGKKFECQLTKYRQAKDKSSFKLNRVRSQSIGNHRYLIAQEQRKTAGRCFTASKMCLKNVSCVTEMIIVELSRRRKWSISLFYSPWIMGTPNWWELPIWPGEPVITLYLIGVS